MATKQQDLKSPTPQPLTAHRPSTKLKPPPPTNCSKMVGPAQLLVYRLRVLAAYLPSPELEVRRQLRGLFSRLRAYQLLRDAPAAPPAAGDSTSTRRPRTTGLKCKLQIPKHQKASPDMTPVLTNALQAQQ